MPFDVVPTFVAALRERDGIAARALEFAILTAARSGEVFGASWEEFDLEARVWTVPAARMKAGREHRVPLSARAVEILREMEQKRLSELVFPGTKPGRPLSVMALEMVLRRMKVDVTVHGFRSAFRDWAGERTHFPREVAEAALAHLVGDAVERAYRRGDALEKRRELMDAWANFLEQQPQSNVVRFTANAGAAFSNAIQQLNQTRRPAVHSLRRIDTVQNRASCSYAVGTTSSGRFRKATSEPPNAVWGASDSERISVVVRLCGLSQFCQHSHSNVPAISSVVKERIRDTSS